PARPVHPALPSPTTSAPLWSQHERAKRAPRVGGGRGGGRVSVLVVGLSHRSASVGLLERTALAEEDIAKLLTHAVATEHVDEALVLATCNRLEVYADARKFHGGVQELTDALVQRTGVALEELAEHLYVHYEDRAVQHLFAVASGLDSMVVGEHQILGQLRTAL